MDPVRDSVEARIAARLRARRAELGLSLGELATRSSVSKSMIAKVENGEASPTAALLGRLCAGLGVSLTALMISVEQPTAGYFAAASQTRWVDSQTGVERTVVAPPLPESPVQIARLRLAAGAVVDYPLPPAPAVRQHIVMLSGGLDFTIGGASHRLTEGDCLFAVIDRSTHFAVPGPAAAEYLVIQQP